MLKMRGNGVKENTEEKKKLGTLIILPCMGSGKLSHFLTSVTILRC